MAPHNYPDRDGFEVRIVNWNIERRVPSSWQAKSLVDEISELVPDVICLTEAWKQSLESVGGYSISSRGVAWSNQHPDERKVLMWSRKPWEDIEVVERLEKTGSAVTGLTSIGHRRIRFVGICIPYHFASPLGQEPRKKPWRQHEEYLHALKPLLEQWRHEGTVIVVGDYNRRIPYSWGPKRSYELLETALDGYIIATPGKLPGVDEKSIDHVAYCGDLEHSFACGRSAKAPDGRGRSDHFGVVVDFHSA